MLTLLRSIPAAGLYVDKENLSCCDWEDCPELDTDKTAKLYVLIPTCSPGEYPEGHFHSKCYDDFDDWRADRSFR